MGDKIRMDSHKLIYHPQRVSEWMEGKNIYPIELEIGLTNACNHRCLFCAVDYTGYQSVRMEGDLLRKRIKEFSQKGVKSIIYAGEGEPLLHRGAVDLINETKNNGIDVAMSTNGVLLTPEVSRECLASLTWIRFSTAAITDTSYEKIHQCKKGDLQIVLKHMQEAVRVKREQGASTTIGVQLLLLPDNKDEVAAMARELKKIGVDYFTVKPFSQHPQSGNILQVDYQEMLDIEKELKEIATEDYKIYFRAHAMKKLVCERGYRQCLALPFMVYIDAKGNVWPCIVFMGKEEMRYGNLYEESFEEIWEGGRRKRLVEFFSKMDLEANCRELCRLDEMNKYLSELKNPGEHVNFI
jgi:radical SAM protein with 4Fe4S-binding SPASM domain